MLLENHPNAKEYAESVIYDLEDLEIEHLYNEAIDDGTIKDDNPGA
jgi:hypothetical protein